MDNSFDVLNPSHNNEIVSEPIKAVVHNFKQLFRDAYPHCPNFDIRQFKIRHVRVPKQNSK
jgi:hypothetical protein